MGRSQLFPEESFPLGAACFGPFLAYHERGERKLIGFTNCDIKPGRRKGNLFISLPKKRFSENKY